ncbi:MAG: DNA repair protein RecN [Alphaproteobacteria bacterium]|nr:DNA repair protein RecN [Alphaproteobacteria bacterium]
MLASLTILNVVLIEKLTVGFGRGLNALTGETGAGKSILLDSLGLALGQRGESGLVRHGADQASVTAEFDISSGHPVHALLGDQGIVSEGTLILRRVITPDGRSRAFVNDQAVSVGFLKTLGDSLVEIHGQFDTHHLLNPKYHRDLLDDFGVPIDDLHHLHMCWQDWKTAKNDLIQSRERAEKARAEEAYLRSAVEQLDELAPQADEEDRLTALRHRLMKREQILSHLQTAMTGIDDIETTINTVWRAIEKTGEGQDILQALDRAMAEIRESRTGIDTLSADIEESEYSLTEIDDRLFALKAQARKHACLISELPTKRDELAGQLNLIEHQDSILATLAQDEKHKQAEYMTAAQKVHGARVKAAQKLDAAIGTELPPLKLDKARFETEVSLLPETDWHEFGMDQVQFKVATNPGAEAGPLHKIASGGEMARFMLALKVVLAQTGTAGTLVFDEVDSGIGGATASAVGERLARLSSTHQVLVVTHSPQVAARAHAHYVVAKTGKTAVKTDVISLPDIKKRQEEIARMLAGETITDEARAAARKLMEASAA